jgi:hypothetical protein
MKSFLARNYVIVLLVVLLLIVGVLLYAKKRRDQKADELRRINKILDSGIGRDGTDTKTLIQGVARANGFDAKPFATAIHAAPGYLSDDEQAVYDALTGKSKAQIASIFDYFLSHFGQDMDLFLKEWMNQEEYQRAIDIIKLAK